MRKFGLIGFPLAHSFSKKYFSEKFLKEHIGETSYELYPLSDIDSLPLLLSEEPDLQGLNVTIPYKTSVIKYLDSLDSIAEEAGAVNTIKIRRNGGERILKGYNTDVFGITESLRQYVNEREIKALVLGTGGSSKAVGFALGRMGITVSYVSREEKQGLLTYSDVNDDIISSHRLIINTTPLGMYPDTDSCPQIGYDGLTPRHILFDLVYNPETTVFLAKGKERGCTLITGLGMLHLQAEKSWSIWNDSTL